MINTQKKMDIRRFMLLWSLALCILLSHTAYAQTYRYRYDKKNTDIFGLIATDSTGKVILRTKCDYRKIIFQNGWKTFAVGIPEKGKFWGIGYYCLDLDKNIVFPFPEGTSGVNACKDVGCYTFSVGNNGWASGGKEGAIDQEGNIINPMYHQKVYYIQDYLIFADFIDDCSMAMALYHKKRSDCPSVVLKNVYWDYDVLPWYSAEYIGTAYKRYIQRKQLEEKYPGISDLWAGLVLMGHLEMDKAEISFVQASLSICAEIREAAQFNLKSLVTLREIIDSCKEQ